MKSKDVVALIALAFTLITMVAGGMAWVETHYVSQNQMEGYMRQVLQRLDSIETALRRR